MNDDMNVIIDDDDDNSFVYDMVGIPSSVTTYPNTQRNLENTQLTMSKFGTDDNTPHIHEINNSIPIKTSHDPVVITEQTTDTDIPVTVNTNHGITEQSQVPGVPTTEDTPPIITEQTPGTDVPSTEDTPPKPNPNNINGYEYGDWFFIDVTYNHIKDINGTISSIKDVPFDKLHENCLRNILGKLCIRKGTKNTKTTEFTKLLHDSYHNYNNKQLYAEILSVDTIHKTIHFPYRLLHILFSDAFSDVFGTIGKSCKKDTLTKGKAGNAQYFWEEVQKTFVDKTPNINYDNINFQNNDVFNTNKIDPSHIFHNGWKSLKKIWKDTNSQYKYVMKTFTKSGNHEN